MTIRQAVDRVIGTTIDYALHPDQHRYQTHLRAERDLLALLEKQRIHSDNPLFGDVA